jgi:hypothetical protein
VVITAFVTLWTQRGAARAQRRTTAIEERSLGLEEFRTLRESAMQDLATMRDEVAGLRGEVRDVRETLSVASDHIRELRPLVPNPPGAPVLPAKLRQQNIGA